MPGLLWALGFTLVVLLAAGVLVLFVSLVRYLADAIHPRDGGHL